MNPQNPLNCLGVIIDGNRRYAREHGLPISEGHRRGLKKFKEVVNWAEAAGIKTIIGYAFSSENWQRAASEVKLLLGLFRNFLIKEIAELDQRGARLRFIGEVERFPVNLQKLIKAAETKTAGNKKFNLVLAMSYGGRSEIVEAIKKLAREKSPTEIARLKPEEFSNYLWTADLPDPDLIIRTSGEERLSNFLPWQSVYSELYFTKTNWPALSRVEFEAIIANYRERQRRFGK
ncbi:MAG: polyprenyl diphosphate synthase [Patescibacteria group bacterium]|mgnify:CR=1 FL=1